MSFLFLANSNESPTHYFCQEKNYSFFFFNWRISTFSRRKKMTFLFTTNSKQSMHLKKNCIVILWPTFFCLQSESAVFGSRRRDNCFCWIIVTEKYSPNLVVWTLPPILFSASRMVTLSNPFCRRREAAAIPEAPDPTIIIRGDWASSARTGRKLHQQNVANKAHRNIAIFDIWMHRISLGLYVSMDLD